MTQIEKILWAFWNDDSDLTIELTIVFIFSDHGNDLNAYGCQALKFSSMSKLPRPGSSLDIRGYQLSYSAV
jgi:hypothetical protein